MAALWADGAATSVEASLWLTPLVGFPAVVNALRHLDHPALVIASRQDPTFVTQAWETLTAHDHLTLLLLSQGNHSLEIPGDLSASLDNLHRVTLQFAAWLERALATP